MKKKTDIQKTHIKVGDEVKILTGDEKGLIGKIVFLDHVKLLAQLDSVKNRERYLTQSEKQKRPENESNLATNQKKSIPQFIHISNLMLWDSENKLASRVGYKLIENKKVRYFKKSGT